MFIFNIFCQRSSGRKCQRRGEGGQKNPKTCQRRLWTPPLPFLGYFVLAKTIMFFSFSSISKIEKKIGHNILGFNKTPVIWKRLWSVIAFL